MKTLLQLTISTWIAATAIANDESASPVDIRFNDHIRPILSEYCFACHGPDSGSRKADLRLDVLESAVGSGAVVAGNTDESELIARINSTDPDVVMPPPDSHKVLKQEHKDLLTQWIHDGAAWQKHWAFIKPERPAIPELQTPGKWAENSIDHFILQGLDRLQLTPNVRADRYTLARRAALTITGLPPSHEMLQSFVNDESDAAWAVYMDRLLASEHAGEHRARYWLDAARYGDTHGMHVDNYREIWPYRDWVVNAFNANMPFDRFVVEQLAGDLLPEPTQSQLIATGFNRCNITTSEGGAIPTELDVRYMVDRVETTATVFLGLTAGCAVCHDHKFDPISQREFYQLGAFFNNTTTPPMDGNQKDSPPVITLPADDVKEEWKALLTKRKQLRAEVAEKSSDAETWWSTQVRKTDVPLPPNDLVLSLPLTADEGAQSKLPESAVWATKHPAGRRGMRFGDKGVIKAKMPPGRTDAPLTISFWIRSPDRLMSMTVFDQTTKTKDKKTIGWRVTGNTQGGLTFELNDGTGQRIRGNLTGEVALTPRSWQHVSIRYSGGLSNSSVNILVNGEAAVLRNSSEDLIDAVAIPAGELKVAPRLPTAGLSDIRIYQRWLTDKETRLLSSEHVLKKLMESKLSWQELNNKQKGLVALFHNSVINKDNFAKLNEFAATQRRRDYIYARSTTTLVTQERPGNARAWVLERGEYDQPREQVSAVIPAVIDFNGTGFEPATNQSNSGFGNRLHLARWLVHRDHPLTARVMVNRLWQSVFGTGLVKTSEDFGVMGERPSHPELVDWLAVEFVESGWDVKHILRLMLTSATYQQNSMVTPDKLEKDTDNRYLSRGPRLRLDAEVLRDQALAVSGLLRRDMGGPGVKPYQPAGLWKVVAITGSNTRIFEKDTGDALYRRSVYSFWKRTSPPPNMAAFNAPTREQCTVRRERTNTPIQALVLMNDPQFVEAARELAQLAIQQESNPESRAKWMHLRALSRPAFAADVNDMTAIVGELMETFQKTPDAAKELINTGDSKPDETIDAAELAAWTMVANTLMNRDDFINN